MTDQDGPGFARAFFWSAAFTFALCGSIYLMIAP